MEGVTDLGMLLYPPPGDLAPTLISNDDGDGGGTSDDFDNDDNDDGGTSLPRFHVGFNVNIYVMLLHTPPFSPPLFLSPITDRPSCVKPSSVDCCVRAGRVRMDDVIIINSVLFHH